MGSAGDMGWQLVKMAAGFVASNADVVVDAMEGISVGQKELGPGETVLLRSSEVSVDKVGGNESLEELVLTQSSLILDIEVDEGFFRKTRRHDYCPLSQIVFEQGKPCVEVKKRFFSWYLDVVFKSETLRFYFGNDPERLARVWAEEICHAAREVRDERRHKSARKELECGVEQQAASLSRQKPKMVAGKCRACHAPLSGVEGRMVTCSYCDTKQTM